MPPPGRMGEGEERVETASWNQYRIFVLENLKNQEKQNDAILRKIDELRRTNEDRFNRIDADIVNLKISAGIWGFISGAIPSAFAIGWEIYKAVKGK